MENNGILNWRNWSIIRRAQVIGALMGVGITLGANTAIPLILETAGRGPYGPLLVYCQNLTLVPAAALSKLFFGWRWHYDYRTGPSLLQWLLAILTNALVLTIVGSAAGWCAAKLKRK